MATEWQELVKVNGSFYCNLSTDLSDQSAYNSLESSPGGGALTGAPMDAGTDLYANKTVLKIGQPNHTIKLIIGSSAAGTGVTSEPLSLDTSEYVSWNSSQDSSPASSPPPPLPPVPPPTLTVSMSDPLTDTCCQFFDQRRKTLHQWIPAASASRATSGPLSLQAKMAHLRREIVSLVNQDDVLFRQLLALSTSIRELRTQQQQQRDEEELEGLPVRMNLSPTPSTASMNSLESSDEEEPAQRAEGSLLTRKKVSYPPSSRNRLHPSASTCGRNSGSSSSPTWSLGSPSSEEESARKTPRSPHSSFYTRVSLPHAKHPHRKHPADPLTTAHRRQGSYDSGIQGSEPSDAEVFV